MKKIVLSIPEPCHEKWEEMEPVEKGRFCAACQKTVIDFSQMADGQIAAYFKKPANQVCGKLHVDQLNREIMIPKKKIPWVRYFFQFTLPAFLVSLKANSQKQSTTTEIVSNGGELAKMKNGPITTGFQKVIGQVKDSSGLPVPFATISIKNTTRSVASDEKGDFQLNAGPGEVTIIVSAIGFETAEQILVGTTVLIVLTKKIKELEPVIVTGTNCHQRRSMIAGGISYKVTDVKLFPEISRIVDTVFSNISIYPNPVSRNSLVKIKTNKVEEGKYLASLFDAKGAVVQISSVTFHQKNGTAELLIGNILAGTYVLCLRNKSTGKQYTKKLIVQ